MTITDAGVVRPDHVTVGVLVTAVGRDVIDGLVARTRVGAKRSDGKLPAHVTAYLTMGLYLFADDDYEEVATKVTGSLSAWGCWDASWSVPTASAVTQARKRLGRRVLAEVFEGRHLGRHHPQTQPSPMPPHQPQSPKTRTAQQLSRQTSPRASQRAARRTSDDQAAQPHTPNHVIDLGCTALRSGVHESSCRSPCGMRSRDPVGSDFAVA
jgi:hypothetical protein